MGRASYYDSQREDSYNQMLTGLIDEQFTRTPFYGVPRMTAWLKLQGQEVNHKAGTPINAFHGAGSHLSEAAIKLF